MLPRTPLRSLSHSWSSNNGRQHHKYSGHYATAAAAAAGNGKQGCQTRLASSSSSSALGSGNDVSSTAAQAVARYRARQFNQSWSRSTPEHIGGVECGTPYLHQTPAGKPRLDWTPSPTTAAGGDCGGASSGDSGMPTPVLRPEQTPCSSDISMDDSIDSVRGVGNGGILIGKIRELQRQLDAVEKEKNDMKSQIEALKAGNQLLLLGGSVRVDHGSDIQGDQDDQGDSIDYDDAREDGGHIVHATQEDSLESSRRSLDFRDDGDEDRDDGIGRSGTVHGDEGTDGVALAATSGSSNSVNSVNSVMGDDQMIQAMSKITHGVHQLEGALRRHLSSSTRSSASASSTTSSSSSNGEGRRFALTGLSSDHPEHLNLRRSSTASSVGDTMAGSRSSSTMGGTVMLLGDVVCGHGTPTWWARLRCGDMVDGRDKDRRWYAACIEKIGGGEDLGESNGSGQEGKCPSPRAQNGPLGFRVKISFEGWSSDWDIWLHSQKDIAELAPRGTHVKMGGVNVMSETGTASHTSSSVVAESSPSSPDAGDAVDTSTDLSSAAPSEGTPRCDSGVKESWELNSSLSPVEFAISGRDQLANLGAGGAAPSFNGGGGGSVMMRARVRSWKVADVSAWVASTLELPQYQKQFSEASVDGLTLLRVGREDLSAIGVGDKMHALKILSHLEVMRL